MSRSVRKHQRRQPYAWLGAGAVTLGLGVSLASGTAVAFADTGTDTGTAPDSDTPAATTPAATSAPAAGPRKRAGARAASALRSTTSDSSASDSGASPADAMGRLPQLTLPSAGATETAPAPVRHRAVRTNLAVGLPGDLANLGSSLPAAPANPAAVVDPSPSMDTSWLPGGRNGIQTNAGDPIVPGEHVQLALEQIAATQAQLVQATFGAGNVFAGLVAVVPEILLASAALSINAWGATTPVAQNFLAATAGIPIITQVAQVSLLSTMAFPALSDASMGLAALFMPVVGLFGADVSTARTTLASARQNGKIYAVVPVRIAAGTQPLINASINGGPNSALLVDTGASGLITTRDKVNPATLGPVIGTGQIGFSGTEDTFNYTTYSTTVDFGSGAVATAPVNIIDQADEAAFKNFLTVPGAPLPYADGILGVGANRNAGPGPASIPTSLLPGELSDGFLLYQNALPFGLGGFMVFGPNLMPTRVSVPGSPDAYLKYGIDGATPDSVVAIIDSGGVTGTITDDVYSGATTSDGFVPAGVLISVYDSNGVLLYSYRTTETNTPFVVSAGEETNTGATPFNRGPIYINYGYDNPYGIGSTDFAIW